MRIINTRHGSVFYTDHYPAKSLQQSSSPLIASERQRKKKKPASIARMPAAKGIYRFQLFTETAHHLFGRKHELSPR